MTGKIFRNSLVITLCALVLCAAIVCGLLYRQYEAQVFTELKNAAEYTARGVTLCGEDYLRGLSASNRLTWVADDGTVLYDSLADPSSMENHADRAEIAEALQTGVGQSEHDSDTFMEKTLYYALRLDDGTVLRVSCTKSTVAAMLIQILEPLLLLSAAALSVSAVLASRLARRITDPINTLDLDHPEGGAVYRELRPLVARLSAQSRTIGSQMDELDAKRREFEALTDNMNEGFLLVDTKQTIVSANQSAMRLLGTDMRANAALRRTGCPEALWQAVETALVGEHAELILRLANRDHHVIANPVTISGQVTGAAIVTLDITEREQREALRQEFTANVSHELKTPLTSISGFAELMKEGLVAQDKIQEFSEVIFGESQRLIRLVEDIIELSMLDEAPAELEREDVDLLDLADEVLESLRPAAQMRGVCLHLMGEHANVSGVWQILDEMIYNLCDNAIKYSNDGGSVTVTVSRADQETRLGVSDTGIGIPYDSQDRVFERFYRVDKSHSQKIGGTGLGLSIVKHGAQLHNARVELQSEPHIGTTITLIFENKENL